LQNHAVVRLVGRLLDGGGEHRLVRDDAARLDATARGNYDLGLRVVDAHRELVRPEATEDHRVDRAEPGTGEHRDDRLGHHRHVQDDPVALVHAEPA
jgi:hypothetical protein